ncbi:hypothetical protein N474_19495 [Pseudoalteromonas luteoviolacea CPMOR-2]|uniref:Uncharacterized protein n=1 Tax=Pseudoalteromonas luteoviolacea DSM 6061 TaxID=1365250 RepID=A0A166VSW7_9GAMM|nr:DUF4105 domain-containing protein [Pseudoalteromonas luteoviolacea]KZN33666.1 hypothetical protein N475_20035 [Pseudoalteromonas luteoviolacea DSM 6061]KZN53758.1 hypothetical protein N474_19495 [Pseudoalteromonas luteoviolacea CPMOR-2]
MQKLFYYSFFLLLCFSANATEEHILNNLSQHKQWLKLLTAYSGNSPKVTDKNFLLSPEGEYSSLNELRLTINAFAEPAGLDLNQHGQCKYPARYLFLKEKLDFVKLGIKKVSCPNYEEYTNVNDQEQLSLVFATGFLGNPASYYGHLLLKINQKNKTGLEQASINFGADIPANEGMLSYIVKGIIGGYDSSFTTQPFFYHFNNYNETEHRDLWEYPIVLSKSQSELVIAHLWELMNVDFQYFFFNRNCAYFMARAIELVLDQDILDDVKPWVGPQEVIQKLNLSTSDGKRVLGEAVYHPSRQTRLYQRFSGLNSTEKSIVRSIALSPENLSLQSISDVQLESKYRIVDTLIDYYQFTRDKKDPEDKNNLYYKKAVLIRYQLAPSASTTNFASSNIPALGRGISRSYIGVDDLGIIVGIRPAYYDALDASYGHVKHAELTMGAAELIIDSGKVNLYSLSLLNIESVKQNYTMLPGDKNHSWFLKVGAEQERLNCSDCLTPIIHTGAGLSKSFFGSDLAISGFLTTGFFSDSLISDGLFAGAKIKASWFISSNISTALTINHRHHIGNATQTAIKLEQRTSISESMDLRLSWEHSIETELSKLSMNFGYYW